MVEKTKPDKLKLYKVENDKKQTHYLVELDRSGKELDKRWYRIRDGSLSACVETLSHQSTLAQKTKRYGYSDKKIEQYDTESLWGRCFLIPKNRDETSLSFFGSQNKYDKCDIRISPTNLEHAHVYLLGIEEEWDFNFHIEQNFSIYINIPEERYKKLKNLCMDPSANDMNIRIELGDMPDLYSEWIFGSSEFGEIKILSHQSKKLIINKEEFSEEFLSEIDGYRDPHSSVGKDLYIAVNRKLGDIHPSESVKERLEREESEFLEEFKEDGDDDLSLSDHDLSN